MTTNATRTAQEVFKDHHEAMAAGDLDALVGDYADDALFITRERVLRGKDGVREAFTRIFEDLPDVVRFDVHTRVREGDFLFLEWAATATGARADDGVETLVVRDGEIVLQTAHYTVQPV